MQIFAFYVEADCDIILNIRLKKLQLYNDIERHQYRTIPTKIRV